MITIGNAALAFLLLLLGFSGHAEAARPRWQREGYRDPYLVSPPGDRPVENAAPVPKGLGEREFTLRHIYHRGTYDHPNLHRYLDIPKDARLTTTDEYGNVVKETPRKLRAKAASTKIERMTDRSRSTIDEVLGYAKHHGYPVSLPASAWTVDEIPGPNHTDKATVITFASMAANAYVTEPFTGEWRDVKGGFNYTDDFGWEQDGLRGHIFADEKNQTVVIGLKGTSMAVFDGAETTGNDKVNDNLFGSCCCGQGGQYLWKQVCDCMTSSYTCNNTCLVRSLQEKSHYYFAARDLYHNVTERYPNADIWMSGHSLGGVVSTLLGLTYGLPVMTFEAFPDAMAANRLGLPTPPGYKIGSHQARPEVATHHYGHTADPVFMGTCNSISSGCTIAGYAFQGLCHTGKTCIYDTVEDFGWRTGVGYHSIVSVIDTVLEKYDEVATCEEDTECQDCVLWKFYESNGTETTTTPVSSTATSTTSSWSRTRTETCKTPGWWGCLDESTTSGISSTTFTSTYTTSTCLTPGWFGCKDEVTTTTSTTVTTTTSVPTSTPTVTTTSSLQQPSSTCATPGWLGCKDETTTAKPAPPASEKTPSPTSLPTARRKECVSRHWYGTCKEWRWENVRFKGDLRR